MPPSAWEFHKGAQIIKSPEKIRNICSECGRERGWNGRREGGREGCRDAARLPGRQPAREAGRQGGREGERDAARQPGSQAARQPGRQADRQTGRECDQPRSCFSNNSGITLLPLAPPTRYCIL